MFDQRGAAEPPSQQIEQQKLVSCGKYSASLMLAGSGQHLPVHWIRTITCWFSGAGPGAALPAWAFLLCWRQGAWVCAWCFEMVEGKGDLRFKMKAVPIYRGKTHTS